MTLENDSLQRIDKIQNKHRTISTSGKFEFYYYNNITVLLFLKLKMITDVQQILKIKSCKHLRSVQTSKCNESHIHFRTSLQIVNSSVKPC